MKLRLHQLYVWPVKSFMDGVRAGASDIHLLPQENGFKVSFRVNGLLQQHMKLDMRVHKILVARL